MVRQRHATRLPWCCAMRQVGRLGWATVVVFQMASRRGRTFETPAQPSAKSCPRRLAIVQTCSISPTRNASNSLNKCHAGKIFAIGVGASWDRSRLLHRRGGRGSQWCHTLLSLHKFPFKPRTGGADVPLYWITAPSVERVSFQPVNVRNKQSRLVRADKLILLTQCKIVVVKKL